MKTVIYFFICLLFVIPGVKASDFTPGNIQNRKKALIFGVTGQDGSYLAEFLLSKNYEVHGVARHISLSDVTSAKQLFHQNPHYFFHFGDVTNFCRVIDLIAAVQPDEIYNL